MTIIYHLVLLVYFIFQEHPLWYKPVNVNSRLTTFFKEVDKPLSKKEVVRPLSAKIINGNIKKWRSNMPAHQSLMEEFGSLNLLW